MMLIISLEKARSSEEGNKEIHSKTTQGFTKQIWTENGSKKESRTEGRRRKEKSWRGTKTGSK